MKRIWILLIAAMMLADCMTFTVYASGFSRDSENSSESKIISVIFDDSPSMLNDDGTYTTRWVDADYAVKAMASMMNEKDELRLYIMGRYHSETSGEEPPKIDSYGANRINNINTYMKGLEVADSTYSYAMTVAKNDFSRADLQTKECWIVILTDGKFKRPEALDTERELKAKLNELAQVDTGEINIAYIPMGGGAIQLQEDPANHLIVPEERNQVTAQVTEVINKIYRRVRMDDAVSRDYLSVGQDRIVVKLNVPMEKVIVFLQYQGPEELFTDFKSMHPEADTDVGLLGAVSSAPTYLDLTSKIPVCFGGRQTPPDGISGTNLKYRVLQGEIFAWQKSNEPDLTNFLDQEIVISVENGQDLRAEVNYQPAVRVGFEYQQNNAPVEHSQDCAFAQEVMEADERCLQEGALEVRLKMLDFRGEELQAPSSPFLYPDKFHVLLRPHDGSSNVEFLGASYRFAEEVEQKKYTMEIQTPWNETVTQVLDVQERHKPLEIVPLSTQIVVDTAEESRRSVKIALKEDGVLMGPESYAYTNVTCDAVSDSLVIGDQLKSEDGSYSFPVWLADPSKHQLPETAILTFQAVRSYSNGTEVQESWDMEISLASGSHNLEAECVLEDPISAIALLWRSQKLAIEYRCDGEKLTNQQRQNLTIMLLPEDSDGNDLVRVTNSNDLEIMPSFSWWNRSERELSLNLQAGYTKYNSQCEAECSIRLRITPIPRIFKVVFIALVIIFALWVLACLIKLKTPWHIKKRRFFLANNNGGIMYDLKLKRMRNLLIPWHTKAVLELGEEESLGPVAIMPALKLVIRNGGKRQSFYLCNWMEFERNDEYRIKNLRITKQNSTFSNEQRFSFADGLNAVQELHIEER